MRGHDEVAKRENYSQKSIFTELKYMDITLNLFIEAQQKHPRRYMFNIFPVKESKKSQRKKKKGRRRGGGNKKQQMVSREHEGKTKEIKGSDSHRSDSYC